MRVIALSFFAGFFFAGCAVERNVLAPFHSVNVPAHGRVAVARKLREGKHHMAYETPGRIAFTMLSRNGVEQRIEPTWGANGEIYAPRTSIYVFEFANPASREALVIFPRDGANHGQITAEEAASIMAQ